MASPSGSVAAFHWNTTSVPSLSPPLAGYTGDSDAFGERVFDLSTQLCVILKCLAAFAPLLLSVCSKYVKLLFPTVMDGMASGAIWMSFLIFTPLSEALPVKVHLIQYSFPAAVRPLNLPSNSA